MRRDRLDELLAIAERHVQAGRSRRAVEFYRKVLVTARVGEPEWELAQLRLGHLHLLRGELEPAIAHFTKAYEQDAMEPRYARLLGRALRLTGEYQRATSHLLDACRSSRELAAALIELAYVEADAGQRSRARVLVDLVTRHTPSHPGLETARRYANDA